MSRRADDDRPPPYLGPRIRWLLAILVLGTVAGCVAWVWWERWVRRGLGWE